MEFEKKRGREEGGKKRGGGRRGNEFVSNYVKCLKLNSASRIKH